MTLEAIRGYLRISDDLATAGQPSAAQLEDVRAAGFDVIVNLALPTSTDALPDEWERVTGLGMDYVHIPVAWESPTQQDLDRFFEVMDGIRGRRVLVHCAMNMRASAFVSLYRALRLSVPVQEAAQSMHRIWEPDQIWQQFITQALGRCGGVQHANQEGER